MKSSSWSGLLLGSYLAVVVALLAAVLLRLNSQPIFWTLYVSMVLLLSLVVLKTKRYRLFAIIVFDIFLYLLFNMQYPALYQVDRDTGFESSYAKEMAGIGRWDPTLGSGYAENYYGYNPLVHFVMALLTLTTKISTDLLAKFYLILIFRILFIMLVFRILQLLLKDNYKGIAYLGLLVYVITPRLRILTISRRLMAALMILFALYCLLHSRRSGKTLVWKILFVVFSFLVVVSDHSLSLLFGLVLFAAVVYYAVLRVTNSRARVTSAFAAFVIYAILWLAWNIFVAPPILIADLGYLDKLVGFFSSLSFSTGSAAVAATIPAAVTNYTASQQSLMLWAQIAFAVISFASFVFVLLGRRTLSRIFGHPDLVLYLSLISFPGLLVSTYLINTKWVVLANIILWFFLIVPSLFFGIFLYSMRHSRTLLVAAGLLALVFCGNILLNYHPSVLFSENTKTIIELPEYKNQDIFDSAEWLYRYANGTATVIADRSVFDIYAAYYGFAVTPVDIAQQVYSANQTVLEQRFLKRNIYFGAYRRTAQSAKPGFIVVNLDLLTNPSYNVQLRPEDLDKFEHSKLLKKVYDNGRIVIYENLAAK